MKNTTILHKQSSTRSVAHIYEHLIANYIRRSFLECNFYRGLDYNIDAETFDGNVFIYFETNSDKLTDKFQQLLRDYVIADEQINKAIEQISCEYESIPTYDFDLLKPELESIANQDWITDSDLIISKETTSEGWTIDNSPIIKYIKDSDTDRFGEFAFVYYFENIPYNLKPLCAYIAQFIALSQIDSFYSQIPCYDIGDDWLEYPFENENDFVGYSHNFFIKKENEIDKERIQDIFGKNLDKFIKNNFVNSLFEFIMSEKHKPTRYFSRHSLFKYTGSVIGAKWFDENVNIENINKIINSMVITVNIFKK